MNTIEPSKSSRAKCRTCKNKIDKAVPRLGVETEFTMNGETVTSTKWHHLECGMEKIPEQVITAEIVPEVTSRGKPISLTEEDIAKIKEFKEKYNISGMAIQGISDIREANKTVNIEAKVLRRMSARTMDHPDGDQKYGTTVYVEDDGHRSKLMLWEDHTEIELNKDDKIVVIGAISELASNENIQFHAKEDAKVLVNPTEDEIAQHSEDISLYVSDAWGRPTGKPTEFTYAPTGRATCGVCDHKISKGELKIVKPMFIELDNDRIVPGNISMHMECVLQDQDGDEVLHEAVTRLNLDLIDENREQLRILADSLPDIEAKSILNKIL